MTTTGLRHYKSARKPLRTLPQQVRTLPAHVNRAARPVEVERIRGRALQERNRRVLSRQPLCIECLAHDRTRAATQVDHRIPLHLGGTEDESNLRGLCDDCHAEKTAGEAHARADGSASVI